MLSGDSMFPRIGDATQRAQLEARTLALLAAGIRTALITALIGPALIAWLTAPTIGLAAAIGPAALLYLITIDRVLFARRVARYLAAPGGASARPWLNAFPFGITTDTPVPGDYDGDGRTDAGVFRPSNTTWYVNRSTAGTLIQQFGSAGDIPLPNAFVR